MAGTLSHDLNRAATILKALLRLWPSLSDAFYFSCREYGGYPDEPPSVMSSTLPLSESYPPKRSQPGSKALTFRRLCKKTLAGGIHILAINLFYILSPNVK